MIPKNAQEAQEVLDAGLGTHRICWRVAGEEEARAGLAIFVSEAEALEAARGLEARYEGLVCVVEEV